MSSVHNLAVAQPYLEPVSANSQHPRAEGPFTDPLVELWENLVRGRLRPVRESKAHDSARLVAKIVFGAPALCPDEASIVQSVLCGDARKALAIDLGIAVSTATGRHLRALAKFGLDDCTVPLTLVLAAQSHAGLVQVASARSTQVDQEGHRFLSVIIPRPVTTCLAALTRVQQQVAQWILEGSTRETIAERRSTSVNTVAGQVHAVFHALRVTGRYALIRRAAELGCFRQPAMSVA